MTQSIYDFNCKTIDGQQLPLRDYQCDVLLIVNTASRCGFTPQYQGLEALYQAKKDQGLVVLGFPCNQFGHQEPENEAAIREFCRLNYEVSFPLFAKVEVNGDKADPLYQFLKTAAPGVLGSQAIKWNFTKFLVDRTGGIIQRYAPTTKPTELIPEIDKLLNRDGG